MDDELKQEGELKRALDALDAKAARSAARVNVERVSARVLERLRTEPAATPVRSLPRALRVAAAVALLVTGGVVAGVLMRPELQVAASGVLPLPTTDSLSLSQAQADSLLESIGDVRAVNVTAEATSGSVEELSEQELRALLQAMQASEGGAL